MMSYDFAWFSLTCFSVFGGWVVCLLFFGSFSLFMLSPSLPPPPLPQKIWGKELRNFKLDFLFWYFEEKLFMVKKHLKKIQLTNFSISRQGELTSCITHLWWRRWLCRLYVPSCWRWMKCKQCRRPWSSMFCNWVLMTIFIWEMWNESKVEKHRSIM